MSTNPSPDVSTETPSREIPVYEDPTPTQKIWAPVANLDVAHDRAFRDFQNAISLGDLARAERAQIRINEIELEQEVVHRAARAYLAERLSKVRHG